jgi:hypothetical protein
MVSFAAFFLPAYAVQPKPNFKNMSPAPQIISFVEADKRFQLSKINFSFESSRLQKVIKKVTLFDGDTKLEVLNGNDYEGDFIIVNGNLVVDGEVRFTGNETMVGMLVLGNATMKTLIMDYSDLKISKDLKVTNYIRLHRPAFEQGALTVDGLVETKYLIAENVNPDTRFSDMNRGKGKRYHYISEDTVHELFEETKQPLKNRIFNKDGWLLIKDVPAFLKLIENGKR